MTSVDPESGDAALPTAGRLVTETLDGGRDVTVLVPPVEPLSVVFAGDGQAVPRWAAALDATSSTMLVGVHGATDETARLHEYSPGFDPDRFTAHERFLVDDVRAWVSSRFGVALPARRTAVLGASAGAEMALAVGLRHPDVFGAVFGASPGAGYRPPAVLPRPLPRTYLVAGNREPFFRENAVRWAEALRAAAADVVLTERDGGHGDAFWWTELPLMLHWAFGGDSRDHRPVPDGYVDG